MSADEWQRQRVRLQEKGLLLEGTLQNQTEDDGSDLLAERINTGRSALHGSETRLGRQASSPSGWIVLG